MLEAEAASKTVVILLYLNVEQSPKEQLNTL
jgi:hypothetical protein